MKRASFAPESGLVFLSHSGEDSAEARELARNLSAAGLDVWLDLDRLRPGDHWMAELETALERARTFLVYVGRRGVRSWVDYEVRVALDKSARDPRFRIIPVLSEAADPEALPLFLKQHQWLLLDGVSNPVASIKNLIGAIADKAPESVQLLSPDRAPFRGLLVFDVQDSVLFYGREKETEELLARLRADSFLAVIGDSGSGKSSLVRAGLIPALHRGRLHDGQQWVTSWRVAILRPGGDPMRELAEALPQLNDEISPAERLAFVSRAKTELLRDGDAVQSAVAALVPAGTNTLIVVDQFEELFTLAESSGERERFVEALLAATKASSERPVHVTITLRADFFSNCWRYERLLHRMDENHYLVRRVGRDQLHDIIEKPLALAGASAEPGLVDALLSEVGDEPGNLPLLQHALLQLWERRRGATLTHDAYDEIGRLAGALEHHADEVYESLKSDAERAVARQIFLNLTQLGEGAEDTRRRAKKDELFAIESESARAADVLRVLTNARLVTTSGNEEPGSPEDDVVEVAHEALIREWPRLKSWVDENRDSLRIGRRVELAAADWEAHGRDAEYLYTGARLSEVNSWYGEGTALLTRSGRDFLLASNEAHRRAAQATRRAFRRRLVSAAALLLLLGGALGMVALERRANREAQARAAEVLNEELRQAARTDLSGTLTIFAAKYGKDAYEYDGRGLLTSALESHIFQHLSGLTESLPLVSLEMRRKEGRAESLEFVSSLNGEIYLNPVNPNRDFKALALGWDYGGRLRLQGAVADAEAVHRGLEQLGYDSRLVVNASKEATTAALDDFLARECDSESNGVRPARTDGRGIVAVDLNPCEGTMLFLFVAGHGFSRNGLNYVIPSDSNHATRTVSELAEEAINVESIRDRMARVSAAQILILDTSRGIFQDDTRGPQ